MQSSPQNDIHEISNAKLQIALWYVRHKVLLYKALVGILIGGSALMYLFTFWKIFEFTVLRGGESRRVIQNISEQAADFSFVHTELKPLDPEVLSLKTIAGADGKKDMILEVRNPNEKVVAKHLRYALMSGGETVFEGETFIWPGETKQIFVFGVDSAQATANLAVAFKEISWQRMAEFSAMLKERANFIFDDAKYENVTSEIGTTGIASFSVSNQTIYNFYDAGFYVLLMDGGEVAAASFVSVHKLSSLQKIQLQANFIHPPAFVTSVRVVPEINILDENAYFTEEVEMKETIE